MYKRQPIYRTFALQNNMADVTAKGESVANLSDILGVGVGIALSKLNWHIAFTFGLLSCGYLFASRMEVDSVVLPYMNQVRMGYLQRLANEPGAYVLLAATTYDHNTPMHTSSEALDHRFDCACRRGWHTRWTSF